MAGGPPDGEAGMTNTTRRIALGALAAACACPALALAQEETVLKGTIIRRKGNKLTLRTATGDAVVKLQDSTKVESNAGVLGVRRQQRYPTELIRGLPIEAHGAMQDGELLASSVLFNPGDLKTAQQISAGINQTENQVGEHEERLNNVGDFAVVGRTKVFFPVGSSKLSAKGMQDLKSIAAEAKGHKGYRLAVVGRADPTGNVAANQKLSEARAAAVTAYLLQSCAVSPGRLLPAQAVGESPVFEDPDPPKSDAEARRVTVTIAVSKATLSSSQE
jgi:outer membrane protein OmpA-like peptidoglycan-associated protein